VPILEHVAGWRSRNGCQDTPDVREMPDLFDEGTVVQRWDYAGCRAETLFYRIEGGGAHMAGQSGEFESSFRREEPRPRGDGFDRRILFETGALSIAARTRFTETQHIFVQMSLSFWR
jgi:poly(3-hydroxybutyrate) depolymerase